MRTWLPWAVGACALGAGLWWWAAPPADMPRLPLSVERVTSVGSVRLAALSADGTLMAWVESSPGGQALWVRAGTDEARVLVPAADLAYEGIAFSPDAESLFYVARGPVYPRGALLAQPLDGRPARQVLDRVAGAPAVSPDGERVACYRPRERRTAGALVVVSLEDDSVTSVMTSPAGRGGVETGISALSWSPDSDRLAAIVSDTSVDRDTLVVVDVSSGAVESLTDAYRSVGGTAWLPEGRGVLLTAARRVDDRAVPPAIWLQPYPEGEAHRVSEDARAYAGLSVNAEGTALVAVGIETTDELWSVPLDARRPARLVAEPSDGAEGLAPLPDGRLVVTIGEPGRTQLAIIDSAGAMRQILTTRGANRWPAVTPDGQTLVFVSDRDGRTGIWRMELQGSEPRLLAHVRDPSALAVTPDGGYVLCAGTASDGSVATWRVSIEGGEPAVIAPGIDRPAVSPDGLVLAGVSGRPGSGDALLVTMRLDGRAPPRVVSGVVPAREGVLAWGTGQRLLYSTADGAAMWLTPLAEEASVRLSALDDLRPVLGVMTPDRAGLVVLSRESFSDVFLVSNLP